MRTATATAPRFHLRGAATAALLLLVAGCAGPEPQARRQELGGYTVVWLHGSPYEMGYQQGTLLRDTFKAGLQQVEDSILLKAMFIMAEELGLIDLAHESSYPEIVEECQGMVDAAGEVGWTMDHCMVLNFGDAVAEFATDAMPESKEIRPGCSQIVAMGSATRDGRLYHARTLDWAKIDFLVDNPVIFVRRPEGRIPHVIVGFPGNLSPYQGMNAEGLSIATNEVDPLDKTVGDLTGRSHVQLVGQLLAHARSMADVRAEVERTNHMSLETLVAADGETGEAEVFEMAPAHVGERAPTTGVLYATNHFVAAETEALDAEPIPESSILRWERLEQLLLPSVPPSTSLHGALDPETLAGALRDRRNPRTGSESPADTFDDNQSLATNGALYQLVFDPEARRFWVAAGSLPVPTLPFTGFSLPALLDLEDPRQGDVPPIP